MGLGSPQARRQGLRSQVLPAAREKGPARRRGASAPRRRAGHKGCKRRTVALLSLAAGNPWRRATPGIAALVFADVWTAGRSPHLPREVGGAAALVRARLRRDTAISSITQFIIIQFLFYAHSTPQAPQGHGIVSTLGPHNLSQPSGTFNTSARYLWTAPYVTVHYFILIVHS